MFTGIIESVGVVRSIADGDAWRRVQIAAPFSGQLGVDDSVAVDGVCLTVVGRDGETFAADIVSETLSKTNLWRLEEGIRVNLERPLKMGGRLDGHIVQGHVDVTGEVTDINTDSGSRFVTVRFPSRFGSYVIPVGSITLDGISFTVARLDKDVLTVAVIPHTWQQTTINEWTPGRAVNLEFDLVGKYVVRALERGVGDGPEVSRRFLTG